MILRALTRRHNAVSRQSWSQSPSRMTIASRISPQQKRHHTPHSMPLLGSVEADENLRLNGIEGLFTPKAFDIAWTEYQSFLIDRLNTIQSRDPTRAGLDVMKLIIQTAREPSLASMFNHASMAYNNKFFFDCLSAKPTSMYENMPAKLHENLTRSFGSLPAMRDTLLATASGMFGPGFVWLVQERTPSIAHPATANNPSNRDDRGTHFRIVNTYLAGTPLPGAHTRHQAMDLNVNNLQTAGRDAQNKIGSFGPRSGMGGIPYDVDSRSETRYGGADIIPVLCVNTWEHCYLHDFGVTGKRSYLARWWDHINWYAVDTKAKYETKGSYL